MVRSARTCWRASTPSTACCRRASSEAAGNAPMAPKNSKPSRPAGRRARPPAAPPATPRGLDLEQVRVRIDAVDEQIHGLINERARLAQQVGISKSSDGRTVDFYRPEREAQVLRLARGRKPGTVADAEVLRPFRRSMSAVLARPE